MANCQDSPKKAAMELWNVNVVQVSCHSHCLAQPRARRDDKEQEAFPYRTSATCALEQDLFPQL